MTTKDIRFVIVHRPGPAWDAGMVVPEAGLTEREITEFANADPAVAGGLLTVEGSTTRFAAPGQMMTFPLGVPSDRVTGTESRRSEHDNGRLRIEPS